MKYLILGAGPGGLSFANRLIRTHNQDSFIVLEREESAGGLCRSKKLDNAPIDIGGGHFLDTKRADVNEFLFQVMPKEEWNFYKRDSRILINNQYINHPFEANIWQMKVEDQVKYLKSIANAGCNIGKREPEKFVDWIYWKLGKEIANNYMIPYNKKMFGCHLDELGVYWLDKLPNVSFEDTLLSCLNRRAYGKQPGHSSFYYPQKYGYGEVWLRMANEIECHIEYNKIVNKIDFNTKTVTTVDGASYVADKIIVTIPWVEFKDIIGLPIEIKNKISKLKFSSIQIEYFPQNIDTPAHWVYYPDLELPFHRVLVRHNFCANSRGYWTETNITRTNMKKYSDFKYDNKYAYPLNTIDKPIIMKELLDYSQNKNIYGLGRWGEWEHYNSDVVVERAIKMADALEESLS